MAIMNVSQNLRVRALLLPLLLSAGALAFGGEPAGTGAGDTAAKPVAARTPSPIHDRFAVRASYFRGSASTDAQIDDTAGGRIGTPFSAEDDFGLADSVSQGRAEFNIRLRERGKLRVGMFDLQRKATKQITRTFNYGDQTFLLNDRVTSEFNWRMFDLTWTYSFIHNDRFELGAGLGLHVIQTEASAAAPARAARESFDGAGPFATVAIDSVWRITRRFSLSLRAQTLDLTVSDISAMLADYHADVQFRWRPNLAVGVGYQSNRVELSAPLENPAGNMSFDVSGPELFLRASF
jgi:hypothetical protein